MINKKAMLAFSLLLVGALIISLPLVSAESEPNDDFTTAEITGEVTVTGSVNATDSDFFKFTIPAGKDLVMTLKKTDTGAGTISTTSYDDLQNELFFSGIIISVSSQGIEEDDNYWNSGDSDEVHYIEISGEGDYTFTVKYTNDSEEVVEGLFAACGIMTAIIICAPLLFIVIIIVVIILIVKRKKK